MTSTRSKTKGLDPDGGVESDDRRDMNLETREYELSRIEQAIKDRENRLRAHEGTLRQQLDEIEAAKQRLQNERATFDRTAADRENELSMREQELAKKWQDIDATRYDTATNAHPEPASAPSRNYGHDHPSLNTTTSPGNIGSGNGDTIKVSFREATESVPYFDGYNIPLARFTRACRRAREIIPPTAERNLTKLLINKLGNRAYYAVEDEPCETVTELIDLLTGAFGSPKTLDQYRGELSTIYMQPTEHILDYISRVKDLRTAILDAERREKRYLDSHFIAEIDGLTARSFCEGLHIDYRLQMGPEKRRCYTEAFAAAKIIAKREELDRQRGLNRTRDSRPRFDREREPQPALVFGRPLAHSTPQRSNPLMHDYGRLPRSPTQQGSPNPRNREENWHPARYENRAGESREYPPRQRENWGNPRYEPHTPDRREPPPRPREEGWRSSHQNARASEVTCRYCKTPGHTIEDCRKRQYNNSRATNQGNLRNPPGRSDATPAVGQKMTRPVNQIEIMEETKDDNIDSQP